MEDKKKWYQSIGVWGGAIAAATPVIHGELVAILPTDTAEAVTNVLVALAGLAAVVGRVKATTKIGR